MTLQLERNSTASVPVEVEGIIPEALRDKSRAEIERLEVFLGNQRLPLAELFHVEGDPSDNTLHWQGDMSGVHWIGAGMTSGRIRVAGCAGRHVGSGMRGGEIHVEGDAGDWVGAEMHGGLIHVRGRAGHLVGSAYRGSPRGMTGGTLLVCGDAGNEIGHSMRRGLLAVGGNAGDLIGMNMIAGTILIFGQAGIRHGAGMRRGTIGLLGETPSSPLPTFRYACRLQLLVCHMIFRQLQAHEFPVPRELPHSRLDLYHGDMLHGGRGELIVRTTEQ